MPIVALEIPESYDSITRPVNVCIVKDLIERLDLPKDTGIQYLGYAETAIQGGGAIDNKGRDASFNFRGRVNVEAEERYIEEGILTTAVFRHDNNYIFFDPKLNVYIKPVYTKTETTVSFTYRATSKNYAMRWRDSIRRRMTLGKQNPLHELIYHYPIPPVFSAILEHIHTKRETVAGYDEDINTWLKKCYDPRLTALSNLSGTRGLLAIPEKQIQVQGWMSFITEPDQIEKEGEAGAFEVRFDYTYQYDKVTAAVIKYPIVVHNQLLDDKYLNYEEAYNPYNEKRKPSFTGMLNDRFSYINYNMDPAFKGVVEPSFDDWKPSASNYKTIPVLTSLVGVELNDPYQIINLLDLGETSLTQSVINFIFRERTYLTTYRASAFHITFYKGAMALSPDDYYVDEDLNVRTHSPMNPRDVHHVRIAVVWDLKNLSQRAKDALRNDPEVCFQVVDLIDGMQRPNLPFIPGVGAYTRGQLINTDRLWLKNTLRPGFVSYHRDWSTVKPISGLYEERIGLIHDTINGAIKQSSSGVKPVSELKTLLDWLIHGSCVVLSNGMEEGIETLIVFYHTRFYSIMVNHFLKSTVIEYQELTDAEFVKSLNGYEYDLVLIIEKDDFMRNFFIQISTSFWDDSQTVLENIKRYMNKQFEEMTPSQAMRTVEFRRLFCGNYLKLYILNKYGIYKPATNISGPSRMNSPSRNGAKGPMLSDELIILGGKVITKPSFDLVSNHLNSELNLTKVGQGRGMQTVMQAGIIAHGGN